MNRSLHWILNTLALAVFATAAGTGEVHGQDPASFSAEVIAGEPAKLRITAKIDSGWKVYSIDQPDGGPVATVIKVDMSSPLIPSGPFKADKPPKQSIDPNYPNLPFIESHSDTVVWEAPLKPGGAEKELKGTVRYQACDARSCLPPTTVKFTAQVPAGAAPPAAEVEPDSVGVYKGTPSSRNTVIRGHLSPKQVAPGGMVTLTLVGEPNTAEHYHLYELREKVVSGKSRPTLIVLTDTAGLEAGQPQASQTPQPPGAGETAAIPYYNDAVTFTVELQVPGDARPGERTLRGRMGYQSCQTAGTCDQPRGVEFWAAVTVADAAVAGDVPLAFRGIAYNAVSAGDEPGEPTDAAPVEVGDYEVVDLSAGSNLALGWMLPLAFVGGLILNLMPCVLPVIGLKVLAFVEQSQHDRRRNLLLNLWYSLGIISVFIVLATFAFFANLSWGEQFTSPTFTIVLAALVFVMALSFLGVWEIPIPGFVGGQGASQLAQQEGAFGAFCKGMVTTVLATPCAGPFVGVVFGVTLGKPAIVTYSLFGLAGLGMASPYLLIGAFPKLMRFLPKPGEWMDTFKQVMGFFLLATVAYFFTFIRPLELLAPTFALLIALWFGCWLVGRVPLTAPTSARLRAWAWAGAVCAAVGAFMFGYKGEHRVAWQTPFSIAQVRQLSTAGHTVMVDFTADWCPNCKLNEAVVYNSARVAGVIEQNGVVPIMADWTDGDEEIKAVLEKFKSRTIPLLAIFPAGEPDKVYILRDVVTRQQVINALHQAGPSKPEATALRTASK